MLGMMWLRASGWASETQKAKQASWCLLSIAQPRSLLKMGTWLIGIKKKQRQSMLSVVSVSNNADRPWAAWSPEPEDCEYASSDFPFVDNELIRYQQYQLNVYKSMEFWLASFWSNGVCGCYSRNLSIIYQMSWESGKIPAGRNLVSVNTT